MNNIIKELPNDINYYIKDILVGTRKDWKEKFSSIILPNFNKEKDTILLQDVGVYSIYNIEYEWCDRLPKLIN